MEIKEIGYLKTSFPTKFGAPRQSGVVSSSSATLIFNEEYRSPESLIGLEKYSHVWVIWGFSEAKYEEFSPTVRPPRLGGNKRVGVFASRSPYRPNSLGLSVLRLNGIEKTEKYGYVLKLSGADMMDSSPVYDIKPYLPFADSIPEASGGFTDELEDFILDVEIPNELKYTLSYDLYRCLVNVLENDPRPSYIDDPSRIYGFFFDKYEIKFVVDAKVLRVVSIEEIKS
ncbi:MAG: tRNA (N6-threonylcarbamoyladenosine(37)-N6)-methyltransferase TrmO [Clostridia bacterium]|nr:tRNA (N6-threonylcarbamoyladenosine(37)-N6)-methyltransferase TrmO [Clostridia bacterium]